MITQIRKIKTRIKAAHTQTHASDDEKTSLTFNTLDCSFTAYEISAVPEV